MRRASCSVSSSHSKIPNLRLCSESVFIDWMVEWLWHYWMCGSLAGPSLCQRYKNGCKTAIFTAYQRKFSSIMGQTLTLLYNMHFILWKGSWNLAQVHFLNQSFHLYYINEDADCSAAASQHLLVNHFNMPPWPKLPWKCRWFHICLFVFSVCFGLNDALTPTNEQLHICRALIN